MMDTAAVSEFLIGHNPDVEGRFVIEAVELDYARVRMIFDVRHTRAGGTVSGPALMALSDMAMCCALVGRIGPALDAVTVHLSIDFLRRPGPVDVIAETRLVKVGKRLATGIVELRSDGAPEVVAVATVTFTVPH
jgi:uncharacterized protein (TIGR00369 family)